MELAQQVVDPAASGRITHQPAEGLELFQAVAPRIRVSSHQRLPFRLGLRHRDPTSAEVR